MVMVQTIPLRGPAGTDCDDTDPDVSPEPFQTPMMMALTKIATVDGVNGFHAPTLKMMTAMAWWIG